MRKYIVYIFILFILIVFLVCIFNDIIFEKEIKIISYEKSYNISSQIGENDNLNVEFLINSEKSYFSDKNQISNCSLISDDGVINIKIVDIIKKGTINYLDELFYSFIFKFELNYNQNEVLYWVLNDTIINLNYNGNINYNIKLGDITFVKVDSYDNEYFGVNKIKPLVKKINENHYLVGIILGLKNLKPNEIIINDILLLDKNICIGKDCQIINDDMVSDNIDEILGYNYNLLTMNNEFKNIKIKEDETVNLFIPIYYKQFETVEQFIISMDIFYIDELNINIQKYKYYDCVNEIIKLENLSITKLK